MDKSRYLTPYSSIDGYHRRRNLENYSFVCVVYQTIGKEWTHSFYTEKQRYFDTKEGAMTSMDTLLVNKGYILLTEEQMLLL